jgi:hypothetical protein
MEARPLRAYSLITLVYLSVFVGIASMVRRSKEAEKSVSGSDIFLLGLATYRLSRLISYDRVTQYLRLPFIELDKGGEQIEGTQEEPKGKGLRLAVGQLLTCAYCSSIWAGTFNSALFLLFPKVGRLFLLSLASSGLAEILDPIFPLLSYLSGYVKKEEEQQERQSQEERVGPSTWS